LIVLIIDGTLNCESTSTVVLIHGKYLVINILIKYFKINNDIMYIQFLIYYIYFYTLYIFYNLTYIYAIFFFLFNYEDLKINNQIIIIFLFVISIIKSY
jgi:hypothetical protein